MNSLELACRMEKSCAFLNFISPGLYYGKQSNEQFKPSSATDVTYKSVSSFNIYVEHKAVQTEDENAQNAFAHNRIQYKYVQTDDKCSETDECTYFCKACGHPLSNLEEDNVVVEISARNHGCDIEAGIGNLTPEKLNKMDISTVDIGIAKETIVQQELAVECIKSNLDCILNQKLSKRKRNLDKSMKTLNKLQTTSDNRKDIAITTGNKHKMSITKGLQKCKVVLKANDSDYYQCPLCSQRFTKASAMEKHACSKDISHKKQTECQLCSETFSSLIKLRKHMVNHTEKECLEYDKKHPSEDVLKKHFINTHSSKEFECEFCNRKFHVKEQLKIHRRRHTGERPFACDICDKKFTRRCNLTDHKKIHTGIKPNSCEYCGRSFLKKFSLKVHLQSQHTGEFQKLLCQYCGKEFRSYKGWKQHVSAIHTGDLPHKCASCSKGFAFESELKKHARAHTKEKSYICHICGKGFVHIRSLPRHIRTHKQGETQNEGNGDYTKSNNAAVTTSSASVDSSNLEMPGEFLQNTPVDICSQRKNHPSVCTPYALHNLPLLPSISDSNLEQAVSSSNESSRNLENLHYMYRTMHCSQPSNYPHGQMGYLFFDKNLGI